LPNILKSKIIGTLLHVEQFSIYIVYQMWRILGFIFIALFYSNNTYSQPDICHCHKHYYKAEKAYYSDNQDSTIYYYKKAFSNPEFNDVAKLYNAASKVIRLGDLDYAKSLLLQIRKSGSSIAGLNAFIQRHSQYNLDFDSTDLLEIAIDSFSVDSFLLSELKFIHDRDQKIRTDYEDIYDEKYKKLVDYGNFLILKNIIERYNGFLPDLKEIGPEGEKYIETILTHSDIEWIAEIFPSLVEAIHKGYMFNENLIYQIDRNIVDSGIVYIYDNKMNTIIPSSKNNSIQNSAFFYQFYGGFDISDMKNKRLVWWPFQKNADKTLINSLRSELCLDSLDDYIARRPYIKFISDTEFLRLFNF